MIRMAELYLCAAEAWNEYEGPSQKVYDHLNVIRRRAGIPDVEVSWEMARNKNKYRTQDGMREIIQQEYYCFKPDTLITTARGQIPIVDVRRGDMVLTHANRMRKVLDTIVHHHIGDMVRIKSYGNGKDLVCTPNHPVRVYNKSTQSYEWRPAGALQKGDRIICFHRSARMHSAIREVSREHYDGLVYNLSVQYDESYVADGRVVHNCSFEAGMVGAY